ncbi:MAG: hypothetical protein E6J20_06080 [Chloroflexi bacterium]|nr:MAG: hypothetical protein E6J20_06080 [Chloroflexota bacterium]
MDENLTVLEQRAATNAVRVGKIVAVAAGVLAGVVGGIFLYRRLRRPTMQDRLKGMSVESIRQLADDVRSRARKPLPTVTVTVNEKSDEPGTVGAIVRKVTPPLVVTAATALLERLMRPDEKEP